MIKLLHTADIHIGSPFKWLGEKGKEQRRQIKRTFSKVVDLAIEEKIDVFLIAGDLFDSNLLSQNEIDYIVSEFRKLQEKRIPACLIGGTHDCLGINSILRRCRFKESLSNVFLLDDETPFKAFEHLGVTIHGKSLDTNKSSKNPLQELGKTDRSRFNVGMIHGSAKIEGKYAQDDWPFPIEMIDKLEGFNYLACGHWHTYYELPTKVIKAAYSGSPEIIAVDQADSGNILIIEISDDGKTKIMPRRVGVKKHNKIELDAEDIFKNDKLKNEIEKHADPNVILEILIKGLVDLGQKRENIVESMNDEYAERLFKLIIRDESHLKISDIKLSDYQENTTIGKFVRSMHEQIALAQNDEEKKVAEDALQYGVALLEGREVL